MSSQFDMQESKKYSLENNIPHYKRNLMDPNVSLFIEEISTSYQIGENAHFLALSKTISSRVMNSTWKQHLT